MTLRQRMVYEVVGLLRQGSPIQDKEHCQRAVEELLSEHTREGDTTTLGARFDALKCPLNRFATSVWNIYSGI